MFFLHKFCLSNLDAHYVKSAHWLLCKFWLPTILSKWWSSYCRQHKTISISLYNIVNQKTKYFLTNTIINCKNVPSSLFQQFGQWSDTRSWKTNKCTFHSHGSFYKQIRAFFVFLVLVFEAPLHSKVALLVYVFGRMWWKLLTFTRGSHTFTLTRGEISSECVTKRVIGRTTAEYDKESEILVKWI